jgi:hypothetical protein
VRLLSTMVPNVFVIDYLQTIHCSSIWQFGKKPLEGLSRFFLAWFQHVIFYGLFQQRFSYIITT